MLRGRWFRFGYACVNFGGLISARDWLASNAAHPAATCAASTRSSGSRSSAGWRKT